MFEKACGSVGQSVGSGSVSCGKLQVRGSACTCVFYHYSLVYEFVFMTCWSVLHKFFWTMETGRKREKIAIYLWMSLSYENENGKFSFFSTEEWTWSRPSRFNFRLQAVKKFSFMSTDYFVLCRFVCYSCYYTSTKMRSASSTSFVCTVSLRYADTTKVDP